jgi:hypothetical protein
MKNEIKQTAVEWLINALVRSIDNLSEDECEHLSNLTKIQNGITNIQMYEDKKICGTSCFVFGMLEHLSHSYVR